MNQQSQPPIIIIRKKGGHGGHHGGAWKVAYADFVTAMMALFIVLWLMNTDVKIRKAISAYFRDPSGTGQHAGSAAAGTGETVSVGRDNMENLKDQLEAAIKKSPELQKLKDYVQMSVTGEGLRIELIEDERGMFFKSGNAQPTPVAQELLLRLADQVAKIPNDLMFEGHTDARPFSSARDYSNWELSTDRANAARRLMESSGLAPERVVQVRGFASQNLRDKEHPESASNRRVSIIVRYQNAVNDPDPAPDSQVPAKNGEPAGHPEPAQHPEMTH